jgi:hypothetical protein
MPLSFASRVSALPEVMCRTVGDEAVLLNSKKQCYFGLDSVGVRMWFVLIESRSIQAAFESLLAEYDATASQLHKDLEAFIESLLEQGLVETLPAE